MSQIHVAASPFDSERPNSFGQIVGNVTVIKRVTGMLARNRLSNVIFLTGPTGSGKTTMARIVARAKLCSDRASGEYEACGKCARCKKVLNDTTCGEVDYHEYDANAITDETLEDFGLMFQRSWELIFIDELQDLAPHLLKRLRKMIEGVTSTIIFTTSHPAEIEDAFRNRLKSYEYEMTRPTVAEIADFLADQFQRHQVCYTSRSQLERAAEALNCEMRPCGEFARRVLSEADGKLTDEYLDEIFGKQPPQPPAPDARRRRGPI